MNQIRFVELVAIAAVILAACAPARSASSPDGGAPQAPAVKQRLVGSILADPAGMFKQLTNPGGNGNVPGLPEITDMVHDGVAYSDDLDVWQPLLAEAVPSAENGLWKISPDGRMETTWRLKPNLKWHDGTPFSSEDFAFAAKFNNDLDIGVVPPAPLALIDAIETPDPRTIVVKWKEPFIEADSMFTPISVLPLPRHILEKPYAEDKANIFSLPYWTTEYVGMGAFKIREWVPGSHMTLVANDQYVLGRPKLDEIEVRFLTDVNIVTANLLSGAVEKHIGRGLGVEQTMQLRDMAQNQN
ncbi:MAG TPA: ABC transporter substrate-binding protein, partial [Chloroflexota bacterium]